MEEPIQIEWFRDVRNLRKLTQIPEPEDLEDTVQYLWNLLPEIEQETIQQEFARYREHGIHCHSLYLMQRRQWGNRNCPRLKSLFGSDDHLEIVEILAYGLRAWKERKAEREKRVRLLRERGEPPSGFRINEDGVLQAYRGTALSVEIPPWVTKKVCASQAPKPPSLLRGKHT